MFSGSIPWPELVILPAWPLAPAPAPTLALALLNYGVALCVLLSSAPVLLDDVLAGCVECIPVPSHSISNMS